jgi:prepilin-type N-terminal cleavage/methylation domain-containing protein
MKTKPGSVAGFSLVEVMCAILILGIGLVGLTHGMTAALRSSKESELQTAAALIAAGQIETLRADGFVIDEETEGDCSDDLSLYRWKQSVTSTSISGLHEVKVVVENSQSGKPIYELHTLLFDPPLDDLTPAKTGDGKALLKTGKREGRGRNDQ